MLWQYVGVLQLHKCVVARADPSRLVELSAVVTLLLAAYGNRNEIVVKIRRSSAVIMRIVTSKSFRETKVMQEAEMH